MITDTGCPDFDRAEYNRYIVKNHLFCSAYYAIEQAVAHTPIKKPLGSYLLDGARHLIPTGELPVVGKKDWRQNSGGGNEVWTVEEVGYEEGLTTP